MPGYARAIIVRIFKKGAAVDVNEKEGWRKVGEKGDRVYAIWFWPVRPSDWEKRWNQESREKIKGGFKLL